MYVPVEGFSTILTAVLPKYGVDLPISEAAVVILDVLLSDDDWTYLRIYSGCSYEIVKASVVDGVINIARAQSGTDRALFPSGSQVAFMPTYAGAVDFIAAEVDVLPLSFTSDDYPLIDGTTITVPVPSVVGGEAVEVVGQWPAVKLVEAIRASETCCGDIEQVDNWVDANTYLVFREADAEFSYNALPDTYAEDTESLSYSWGFSEVPLIKGLRGSITVVVNSATTSSPIILTITDSSGLVNEEFTLTEGVPQEYTFPLALETTEYSYTEYIYIIQAVISFESPSGNTLENVTISQELEFNVPL